MAELCRPLVDGFKTTVTAKAKKIWIKAALQMKNANKCDTTLWTEVELLALWSG